MDCQRHALPGKHVLFAVIFKDHPDKSELRADLLPAHLDWIDAHHGTILVAGSLRDELHGLARGGLWIVDADSKLEVQALLETDPFFMSGLRASFEVLHWSKAFPDRKQPV